MNSDVEGLKIIGPLKSDQVEIYIDHLVRHMPEPGFDGKHSQPYSLLGPLSRSEYSAEVISNRWNTEPTIGASWEVAWGLYSDNQIVGHIDLRSRGFAAISHRARLGMGIEKSFRGKGAGRRLLSTAIEWAKAQSFLYWIDLQVFDHNKSAIALYESVGFQRRGLIEDALRVDDVMINDAQYTLKLR